MKSPNIAILSDHHIVSDGDQGIHTVRVPGELVRVEAVLVLAENRRFLTNSEFNIRSVP